MSRKSRQNGGLRFQPAGGERRNQVPVGKRQELVIERLADDGRGIAFLDRRTWFVSGALPGERVQARVLHARSQVVDARTEQVLESSASRRSPPCIHADRCGGCSVQHLSQADQVALKMAILKNQLARLQTLATAEWAEPLSGAELGYRRRARVAVHWNAEKRWLDVGFRGEASRQIVSVEQCPVLVQPLQSIFRRLPALLRSLNQPRHIGHVELFSGNEVAVLVRHTAPLDADDLHRLRAFAKEHSVQLWLQGAGEPQAVLVEAALGYTLGELFLAYQPGDFVQVNGPLNDAMVNQALDWLSVQQDERVLDLFCGLGNFALPLARQAREVVAVEGVEDMVERARDNARHNGFDNVHVHRADLFASMTEHDWSKGHFAALLLDPPRDGALDVVRDLAMLDIARVLYVSCNPATLARDAAVLEQQGYRLRRIGMIDMFPQTAHVEAMALFEHSVTSVAE